jgi:hypothetical protein
MGLMPHEIFFEVKYTQQKEDSAVVIETKSAPLQSMRPSVQNMESANFMAKVKAAWAIFFPSKPEKVSAGEAGKSRLRMILVADRSPPPPLLSFASLGLTNRSAMLTGIASYELVHNSDLICCHYI